MAIFCLAMCVLGGCNGGYAVRPVPRILADGVNEPIAELVAIFGEPRKVDTTPTKLIYVWFLPQKPSNASPSGFNGCEVEVSVDARSRRVLGYSQSNLNFGACRDVRRKIPVKES
jgi:hypothetical protein